MHNAQICAYYMNPKVVDGLQSETAKGRRKRNILKGINMF